MSIVLLAMTFLVTLSFTYAWMVLSDATGQIKLEITKIDSVIYLYRGLDTNYNGVPDLLSDYSSAEQEELISAYPNDKREYYQEKRAFEYLSTSYALSFEPEEDEITKIDMGTIYPTMVKTFKFSAVNNSDGTNWIRYAFSQKIYSNLTDVNLLKTMAVRVGKVVNNTLDKTSSDINVEYGDKVYFYDYISGSISNEFSVVSVDDAYEIKGYNDRNEEINDDVLDLWFQFEMESYESLCNHNSNFDLTESEYNALQGKELTLPDLKITLELKS